MTNPLLEVITTPFEAVPFDKIKPEHFEPAFDIAFENARNEIANIVNSNLDPTFKNTVECLDYCGKHLGLISGILFNLNSAETNTEIQRLARNMSPRLSEYSNDITMNPDLFARVKAVYENTDRSSLTAEQITLLDNTYKQFQRSGALLSEADKVKFRSITKELSELTVKFGENVLAATNAFILSITNPADLTGMPEDALLSAHEDAQQRQKEGWVFTLQFQSLMNILKYADNRDLRKQVALANGSKCMAENENNNIEIVRRIVNLRLQMAQLLGFTSFANYVLVNRMAESSEKVDAFQKELLDAALPAAKNDLKLVQEFATRCGANYELQAWDWSYYSEKLKKEIYSIDDEVTRPYFKLDNMVEGVFNLAHKLFDLTFIRNNELPVYHKDVQAYEVYDFDNRFMAVVYLDFFPRETKRQGAWMTEFRTQYILDGKNHRPHISLVFNFSRPTANKPSLLTYNEVRTLLHEFGHGLHGMLSDVNYSSLSGTSVYRDFVELPSQLLENWSEQKEWLDQVAKHYETEEKIPVDILNKILESKNYLEGYACLRQLSFGITDMTWHAINTSFEGDIIQFEKKVMEPTRLLPTSDETAMSPSFSHIFAGGYAAGYYGYKWAEVLDADAFSYFKHNGIYDKDIAKRFRDCILSKGGTEHPMKLYLQFSGKTPSIQPLLERSGLIRDADK